MPSGEKLPTLVPNHTRVPFLLPDRWSRSHRRFQVASSTLEIDLRGIGKLYTWAYKERQLDLDQHLSTRDLYDPVILNSLITYMHLDCLNKKTGVVTSGTYNTYLRAISNFLQWCLYLAHRGGKSEERNWSLARKRLEYDEYFMEQYIPVRQSETWQPLTYEETNKIRNILNTSTVFAPETRLRNWIMFNLALELGLRRGELLKLRLDSIPRGRDKKIKILRNPDDPHDTRADEPNVKTMEREIPASKNMLQDIHNYLTLHPPAGRPSTDNPYLFLSTEGNPLSVVQTHEIIKKIGKYTDIENLNWHRLRHTWAERMVDFYIENKVDNYIDQMMYLGGWFNPQSVLRYTRNANAKASILWQEKRLNRQEKEAQFSFEEHDFTHSKRV